MENWLDRSEQMLGREGIDRLGASRLLIVGIGGVGSYAAEAACRGGVGSIAVMDGDAVAPSNINRQLIALSSTVGRNKAELMAERMRDINPGARIAAIPYYYRADTAANQGTNPDLTHVDSSNNVVINQRDAHANISTNPDLTEFDWIIDAIDDVDAKVALIKEAKRLGINIISAMGAAGKFETQFKTADISETSTCPLARVMRRRLKAEGIEHLPVVYSTEKPIPRDGELGSLSYVPGAMGLELAGYIIKQITRA